MRKTISTYVACCLSLVLAGFLTLPAFAGEPPSDPILMLETGMHTSMIGRLSVDARDRIVATASNDKTVRIWDLQTGRLLKILRPPVAPGNEGKIYTVSITPDGSTVACGGWTGYEWDQSNSIYVFDVQTGEITYRLADLANVILHLSFSKDGRYLAACIYGEVGLKIYDVHNNFNLVFEDTDFAGSANWCDWDASGRLAVSSADGYIRLYDQNFNLIAKQPATGSQELASIVFSPDGSRLAVGYNDLPVVDVHSGLNLAYLFTPDTSDLTYGNLLAIAWSRDGRFLYAGGMYCPDHCPVFRWDNGGEGERMDIDTGTGTVTQILPLRIQGAVFSSFDPAWTVIDGQARVTQQRTSEICDFRNNQDGFMLNHDGTIVGFSYENRGTAPAAFAISDRNLVPLESVAPAMSAPKWEAMTFQVTDWNGNRQPKLNGMPLTLQPYERSMSLAIMPDESGFVLGCDWTIRYYDNAGNQIWSINAPAVPWSVNITQTGEVVAAAMADGSIRWYRTSDGTELLAFYPHQDRKSWVLWTPTGFYDASPGAEDLIGWHVNRGKDMAADFFPASRFRDVFYRPDIVGNVLNLLDESQAITLADAGTERKRDTTDVTKMLPPVISIVDPQDGVSVSSEKIILQYTVRSPTDAPVENVRVFIDGRPVSEARDIEVVGVTETPDSGMLRKEAVQEITVEIPSRDVQVSLIAENKNGASEPAIIDVTWSGEEPTEEFVIKPKLYVLAVGVSDYDDDRLDLAFAAKDAKDFTEVVKQQEGGFYRDVEVLLLTEKQATKDDILDGLEWIERQTTQHDVAMIFFAGHGVNDNEGFYYFVPSDVEIDRLRRTGLPFSEIKRTVSALPGKALFFVDTCHSGNVMGDRRGVADVNALVNELTSAENGAVVFTSSSGSQYSLEDNAWNNGAFTKALVEGMGGAADFTNSGRITVNMLDLYISERVKELTKGQQTPTTTKPKTISDFPVAAVN